jgi:hypothetical protein
MYLTGTLFVFPHLSCWLGPHSFIVPTVLILEHVEGVQAAV